MKIAALFLISFAGISLAQPPPGAAKAKPPQSPRAAARIDLTGYWVSVVTEDWRWRMVTPIVGDFAGVPLNAEGRRIGDAWNPAADEAAGEQCRAYGAAGVMRLPGRIHITWQDDTTLKIETSEGSQTRLIHFGGAVPANEPASWQGYSVAQWEQPVRGTAAPQQGLGATRIGNQGRSLEITTTRLKPGYLRKNGAPYSANAVVKEFVDLTTERNGDTWIVFTTIVEDPTYLSEPYVTSSNFKKEPDGSKFQPAACSAR